MAETPTHSIYSIFFYLSFELNYSESRMDSVIMSGCKLCPKVDPNLGKGLTLKCFNAEMVQK